MHRSRHVYRNEQTGYKRGYPEVGEFYMRAALEEAEHAAKFAELLGEVVVPCTKTNLQMRAEG